MSWALLLEPFGYAYMTNAMWVATLVGAVCAFLSCFLMLKGWSLIGDALSHSIVPGVAGAYMLGLPFSAGAFFAGLMAAGAIGFLNRHTRLKPDVIIGLIFSTFFGLGLFMVSVSPTSVNIQTIVLGNILAASNALIRNNSTRMKKDLRTSRGLGEKVYTLLANSDLQEADFITSLSDQLPEDALEAASVDGASAWQRFRYVINPLLRPMTVFVVITSLISYVQAYVQILIMTEGGPGKSTYLISYIIFDEAFQKYDFGYASAIAFVLLVITAALTALSFSVSYRRSGGAR